MKTARVLLCTGGIGCGKSCVVQVFRMLGVPAYDCDRAAKELYDRDPRLLSDVAAVAGADIVDAAGRLDRALLSQRIFSDPELLSAVEALVHPAVLRDFAAWRQEQAVPLVVIESAILLEKAAFDGLYDSVVAVTAPAAERVERVMARDGVSAEQVRRRMAAQWSDEERALRADYTLNNDDRQALLPAIMDIIDKEKRRWKRQI